MCETGQTESFVDQQSRASCSLLSVQGIITSATITPPGSARGGAPDVLVFAAKPYVIKWSARGRSSLSLSCFATSLLVHGMNIILTALL